MRKKSFGATAQGREATLYLLENQNHTKVSVTDYGATLVSFVFRDKEGEEKDILLGYDDVASYERETSYLGATVGRNCNRIAGHRFSLNGKEWELEDNDNGNNLHSGSRGVSRIFWDVLQVDSQEITFYCVSAHGEQGFPGNLRSTVTYTLTDGDELRISYFGEADADTVMNFTNHAYFNLGGHGSGSIEGQWLQIFANQYTPLGEHAIPTGEIADVAGTPMDFGLLKQIGRDIGEDFGQLRLAGGYDHNYVLAERPGTKKKMAEAFCEETGIALEAFTDCCGVQLYTANFLGDQFGKGGAAYHNRSGFCLESQFFPNAVNEPQFPSPVVKRGETYRSQTSYHVYLKR